MLRGESCGACGGTDDCCGSDDDRDRAESPVAGRMFDGGARASRVITVCRRRTTGVGEDVAAEYANDADAEDEDVVEVVLVWALAGLVLGGASGELEGETSVPKGVSSSFILEEDATFRVAGRTRC